MPWLKHSAGPLSNLYQAANILIVPTESLAVVSLSRLHALMASTAFCRDEQYDFFFDAPAELSGDYTISISAQLGQGSSGGDWKVDMFDFVGNSWSAVGDLSEGELPLR